MDVGGELCFKIWPPGGNVLENWDIIVFWLLSLWNKNAKIQRHWIWRVWRFFKSAYCKVANSRPVYYSISDLFIQRSQYINIKLFLHKQSENPWVCYQPRQSTAHDFTVLTNTWLVPLKLHDKLWYMWKPVINILYNCYIMKSKLCYGYGWQVTCLSHNNFPSRNFLEIPLNACILYNSWKKKHCTTWST